MSLSQQGKFSRELLLCRRGAMAAHHLPTYMGYLPVRQVGVAGSTPVDGTHICFIAKVSTRCYFFIVCPIYTILFDILTR